MFLKPSSSAGIGFPREAPGLRTPTPAASFQRLFPISKSNHLLIREATPANPVTRRQPFPDGESVSPLPRWPSFWGAFFFLFCVRFLFASGLPAALKVSSSQRQLHFPTQLPLLPPRRHPRPSGGAAFRLNLPPRQVSALGAAALARGWRKPQTEPYSFAKAEDWGADWPARLSLRSSVPSPGLAGGVGSPRFVSCGCTRLRKRPPHSQCHRSAGLWEQGCQPPGRGASSSLVTSTHRSVFSKPRSHAVIRAPCLPFCRLGN